MRKEPQLIAQMSRTKDGAHWSVYVCLFGTSTWPETLLPARRGIPSLAARTAALKRLGFTPLTTDSYWNWVESENTQDSKAPAHLIASVAVEPVPVPAKSERLTGNSSRRS
ncbi:DUF6303 family protein [Streptomyces sp. NPDC059863]|uniref:DUF6303 family protein n=1 Tax=unclassified Streptomyces TaxID=2593676 RepID=UPI003667B5D6